MREQNLALRAKFCIQYNLHLWNSLCNLIPISLPGHKGGNSNYVHERHVSLVVTHLVCFALLCNTYMYSNRNRGSKPIMQALNTQYLTISSQFNISITTCIIINNFAHKPSSEFAPLLTLVVCIFFFLFFIHILSLMLET